MIVNTLPQTRMTSSDSDNDGAVSDSSSESDSDEFESEIEEKHFKKRKVHAKKAPKIKKRKVRFIPGDESEAEYSSDEETKEAKRKHKHVRSRTPTPSPPAEPQSEIDQLVDQLSRLSVSDPTYASLFFKACRLDPRAWYILKQPSSVKENMGLASGMPVNSGTIPNQPPVVPNIMPPMPSQMPSMPMQGRDIPPHMAPMPY